MTFKTLLGRVHLYLGVFFTPLILLFGATGAVQVFRLHESRKDGSYKAPQWLHDLAEIHTHGSLGSPKEAAPAFRELIQYLSVGVGIALVATTLLGVYLAFTRTPSRKRWMPATALALGLIVPGVFLLLQ